MTQPFPFTTGESHVERAHPHIVERLRTTWGYPEGGRYLAKLIVDSRGGRTGFSKEVMSELLTLATLAAEVHAPLEGTLPFKGGARVGEGMRKPRDKTLQPLSFRLHEKPKGVA
ncbi:MAG TPA: hypothetical protein VGN52_24265 [Burkholderiales bacterium]